VPSLNLNSHPCGGTAKKITSSAYKKFVEGIQKKKIKQVIKFKPNWLELNCLLGPSKRRKKMVCQLLYPGLVLAENISWILFSGECGSNSD
jgi:hypothetical protein